MPNPSRLGLCEYRLFSLAKLNRGAPSWPAISTLELDRPVLKSLPAQ
jgi:hypothetical protein